MTSYVLTHLNLVRPTGSISLRDERVQFFFKTLQELLPQAKAFDGLKWHNHGARMPDGQYLTLPELSQLETTKAEDNPHVITMGGWESPEALHKFAYRLHDHKEGMRRLHDWVDRSEGATVVMWWSPPGLHVSIEDGWNRLQKLRCEGPSPDAFDLRNRFDPPALPVSQLRA